MTLPRTFNSFEREDDLRRTIDAIKDLSDWEPAHPHPDNPHIVTSRARERLRRDGGGYAVCGVCGPCYIYGDSDWTKG